MEAGRKRPGYSGMTLNERLFNAGILDAFDAAARRRDRGAMVRLIQEVDVTRDEAERSVDTILANPEKYGY